MKFLIVVLAVASLCLAEPEADPAVLYAGGYLATPYAYAPYWVRPAIANGYGYTVPGGATVVNRLDKREAEPQVLSAATLPYSPFINRYNVGPFYTTQACVTPNGCAVRNLKDHGIAKRDAEADASALLYTPYSYAAYAPYSYAYVPRVVAPVVSQVNTPVTYTHLGAHPVEPTTVVESRNYLTGHALLKRDAEADASALLYTPYSYAAYAPYTYAYVPRVVAPVVGRVDTPVTYTHLGAHPVEPTTVTESRHFLAGHTLLKREAEADASALLYTPYSYAAYSPYAYAYTPRVVAPVVSQVNTPVTYTHLGAHPVQPTTVVESRNYLTGHALL